MNIYVRTSNESYFTGNNNGNITLPENIQISCGDVTSCENVMVHIILDGRLNEWNCTFEYVSVFTWICKSKNKYIETSTTNFPIINTTELHVTSSYTLQSSNILNVSIGVEEEQEKDDLFSTLQILIYAFIIILSLIYCICCVYCIFYKEDSSIKDAIRKQTKPIYVIGPMGNKQINNGQSNARRKKGSDILWASDDEKEMKMSHDSHNIYFRNIKLSQVQLVKDENKLKPIENYNERYICVKDMDVSDAHSQNNINGHSDMESDYEVVNDNNDRGFHQYMGNVIIITNRK